MIFEDGPNYNNLYYNNIAIHFSFKKPTDEEKLNDPDSKVHYQIHDSDDDTVVYMLTEEKFFHFRCYLFGVSNHMICSEQF